MFHFILIFRSENEVSSSLKMRQRIYLVLIALLCVFIFYLLFLNGFRLFPDQAVGSDKAKDQTGLRNSFWLEYLKYKTIFSEENVIDQEPDSSDERWFQATTKWFVLIFVFFKFKL